MNPPPPPGNPWQPSGDGGEEFGEKSELTRRDFDLALEPLWELFHLELEQLKPEGWHGYHCEFAVLCRKDQDIRTLQVSFREGRGNRSIRLDRGFLNDLAIRLHSAYRNFSPRLEWHKATFSQLWNEEQQGWNKQMDLYLGRVEVEAVPKPGPSGEMGLS